MGLFIKREKFKEYMLDDQPDIKYDENTVLLSLNTVRGKAVTNCIHFSKEAGLYAAQYESMAFISRLLRLRRFTARSSYF